MTPLLKTYTYKDNSKITQKHCTMSCLNFVHCVFKTSKYDTRVQKRLFDTIYHNFKLKTKTLFVAQSV